HSHREAIHVDSRVIWIVRGSMSFARLVHEVAEAVENSAAAAHLPAPQPVRTMADDERRAGVDGLLCEGSEELGGLVAVVARLLAMEPQTERFGDRASATYFGQDFRDVARIGNEVHRGRSPLPDCGAEHLQTIVAA